MSLVHEFLQRSAARTPDKEAIIFREQRLTYADLEQRANRLAHGLIALGVTRGDRVIIWHWNAPETCVAIFAVLKAGAAFVMVDSMTKADKLVKLVGDCRPSVVMTGSRSFAQIAESLQVLEPDAAVVLLDSEVTNGAISYSDLVAPQPDHVPAVPVIDRDLAALIYTSGSTGMPKGVMSAHYNMVAAASAITTYLENVPEDVILNVLSLAFDYGLYQLLMTMQFGGTLVLETSFAFPRSILDLMRQEGVTGFPGVPSIFALLLQVDPQYLHLPNLRYITNTGAALPVNHIQQLQALLGEQVRIYAMYGQTECKRTLYLPPEDFAKKPGSVGHAIPNEEVYLLDADGNRVGPGGVGELYVRGANVMLGYWERPAETARTFLPGPLPGERVLRSFDIFRQDEDGYLYFVSRTDDIIKCRGHKVSPVEVEEAIYRLGQIAEVAVLGQAHPVLGEAVVAFVVTADGTDLTERYIIRGSRGLLEDYMVPERVIFVDQLPKNTNGKIDRQALKARLLAEENPYDSA